MAAREADRKPGSIIVCTDGSGNQRTKIGAWAFVAMTTGGTVMTTKSAPAYPTTNNLMEMQAVIEAVKEFPKGNLHIVSDSRYVIDGITDWVYGWQKKGWVTGKGDPVKNRSVWETLIKLIGKRDVTFQHVRGHQGHTGNEMADKACTQAVKDYLQALENEDPNV